MEQGVFPRPEIVQLLRKFVTVQLYTDYVPIGSITAEQTQQRAELNQQRELDLTQEATNPFYVVLSPDGQVIARLGGYNEPPVFSQFLKTALAQVTQVKDVKVAQAGPAQESPKPSPRPD